ncbi:MULTISPECIES: hypothetical protein [unclassified Streptomyces]|uniref:hypothetical protein n=1 Tax=unclassified Streptomyces TaxID=2593676 RepID=UPI00324CE550|nr:hypothetical protein OG770_16375 [Streptomyces sp. NBC_01185]
MAVTQLNAVPYAPQVAPHPMANPGYGKRSAPDQRPREERDFAHLPPREAAIASYVDRLPDGSDISVKTLAKVLPYGQCALRTALNRLQAAGHLRRGSECVATDEVMLWVTRTFFSRTARDDDWWAAFIRGDAPREAPRKPTRSRAFVLLAALGRTAPALSLSAAECAALEPQASEWFERGATEAELLHALTQGLPVPVHHAPSLVRRRLADKLPPHRPAPERRAVLLALECGECRAPGSPEALTDGLCATCRGEASPAPGGPPGAVPTDGVRERIAQVRAGLVPRTERTVRARRMTPTA